MLGRWLATFRAKSSLIWELRVWQQRAIINEERVEYWQGTAKFYRTKWHEALALLPADQVEKLTKSLNDSLPEAPQISSPASSHQ
jgi:hypothetical protein